MDKPERQGAECPLFLALKNLRKGEATDNDLAFWASRSILGLKAAAAAAHANDEWGLENPQALFATCYNRDRDDINQEYVIKGVEVVVVRALCSGFHATSVKPRAGGQAVRIQRTSYFFIGMTVLLSVNIVPELGLANNARGTVVAILYPAGGYDPSNTSKCPVIVVDFLGYTGPPWDPQHPTWVPIHAEERRCDRGCCSRTGIPLGPGKAGSVHSFQGLSVGDNKPYNRIVLVWDKGAEGRFPGSFYVGASRAMGPHNLALRRTMTKDDMTTIVEGGAWKTQRIKVNQLLAKAREFRGQLALRQDRHWHSDGVGTHHWGSKFDFQQRLDRFIDTHQERISQSQSILQTTKDEALQCLAQWRQSLQALENGFDF